jgi:hypothetical protein
LRKGEKVFDGDTKDAINIYLRKDIQSSQTGEVDLTEYPDRDSLENIARITRITLRNTEWKVCDEFKMGEEMNIDIEAIFFEEVKNPIFDLILTNSIGQYLSLIRSQWEGFSPVNCIGLIKLRIKIPKLLLTPGTYFFSPQIVRSISEGACLDIVHLPVSFDVLNNDITGNGSYMNWNSQSTYCMHISSFWDYK